MQKIIKVLMVSTAFPPYFGGAAIQAIRLATELKKIGIDVSFITDNKDRKSVLEFYKNIPVFRCSTISSEYNKLGELIFSIKLIIYILLHPEFDIIHFHSLRGLELLTVPFIKLANKKVILKLTLIGVDDPLTFKSRKRISFLYMWGVNSIDKFIAISSRLRELSVMAGVPREKIMFLPNGVNIEHYKPVSEDIKSTIRQELGIGAQHIFLSVGKIEQRKRYEFLIEAWKKIRLFFDNPVLLIGGPGNDRFNPYYLSLKKKVEMYGFNDVNFLGEIDNVEEFMKISDCFVFCSKAEGFGTVVVEAMASGVPVVAMDIPGVTKDIVHDQRVGRICYSERPEDFADMVIKMVKDSKQSNMNQAVKAVQEKFSISVVADKYRNIYEELMTKQ